MRASARPWWGGRPPLARLTGLLTSAGSGRAGEDGRPAIALVAGEAGIGKTRLLRELMRLTVPGTVVLAGQAEPGALGRPYELVESLLGALPPAGDDQTRAVVDAIESELGDAPALVVFEDLHWADAESVAVFERLAGAPKPSVLLVGTYRPDELTRRVPAAEMLVRLERRHQIHQFRLDRLDRPAVSAFLTAVYQRQLPSTVADTLFNRTGGNPFFLEELLVAAGESDPDQLLSQPLPWSLNELVLRQLDGLSPEERRVVEAAAVLGRRGVVRRPRPHDRLGRGRADRALAGPGRPRPAAGGGRRRVQLPPRPRARRRRGPAPRARAATVARGGPRDPQGARPRRPGAAGPSCGAVRARTRSWSPWHATASTTT